MSLTPGVSIAMPAMSAKRLSLTGAPK